VGGASPVDAVVTAIDMDRDLAVLRLPPNDMPVIETSSAEVGAAGLIVGGATSGTVRFEVMDVVMLSIEEILGTDRHSRLGYELEAATTTGDSGAGAYDANDHLIGIVFATGQDGASTWITSSAEIEDFLAAHDSDVTPIMCDAAASQLARS
jgi:hypothetical protein